MRGIHYDSCCLLFVLFFFKQKTAYEMRISDWSSDVCSSDLWKTTRCWDSRFDCLDNCWSRPARGEPSYPEMKIPISSPRRWSRRRWSRGSRTSACTPEDRKSVV